MLTCGLVILNYRDYSVTEELLRHVKDIPEIDYIVVVDNDSPNESYSHLRKYESPKISVIQSGRNGGYSFGNNTGARYLIDKFHPDIIGIANPDVIFDGSLPRKVKELFASHSDYAVVTGAGYYLQADGSYIPSNTWGEEKARASSLIKSAVKSLVPFSVRRVLKKILHIDSAAEYGNSNIREVWAVCGCLFFIRTEDFVNVGMFDENIFLYCEEFILACKLQRAGRKTVVTNEATFYHDHRHPKTALGLLESEHRELAASTKSEIYFFENYVTNSKFLHVIYRLLKKLQMLKHYTGYGIKKAILTLRGK